VGRVELTDISDKQYLITYIFVCGRKALSVVTVRQSNKFITLNCNLGRN